ncbi:MAG: hypothetical protein M3430_02065 [Acidobacteriota bacterium]|nr:hypothetical protein [Acidobacteriota bacterium]
MALSFPANALTLRQSEPSKVRPADVLRSAQRSFIRSKSGYFKPATLENELLKHAEIQQWGVSITREEAEADLIIEVDRKLFTTKFVYSVLDPRANRVIASGKVSSIGGTVEDKIADKFIKQMRESRAVAPTINPK